MLDLIEFEQGYHLVVREWARAFPLDQLLAQSSLPNRRAATVVAEVAEALAHAHEHGVYHRRLSPHQVLLKQSGAVRVVGLGVATALAPVGRQDTIADLQHYEQVDVQALGKLAVRVLDQQMARSRRRRLASSSPPSTAVCCVRDRFGLVSRATSTRSPTASWVAHPATMSVPCAMQPRLPARCDSRARTTISSTTNRA
ncbi:protein kinase [Aeromicrobium sp. UC242_57]|uniref:protein kinase domain-containing protein n=1 Tax=Aeromicrobium sp. UC242_57 TaxID=3374624 RepID=UPI0037B2EE6D